MAGHPGSWRNAGEAHFLESDQAMQPCSQNRQIGLGHFLFDMLGDVRTWLYGRQHHPRRQFPLQHHRGAFNQIDCLDAFDDIRARGRDRHQDEIGAAEGKNCRLGWRSSRVNHHHVMRIVQFADEGHDFGFVNLVMNSDRVLGRGRDPIRQGMIEIRIHGRNFDVVHGQAGENESDERGFPRPALSRRYGNDAHYEPRFLGA